LKRFIDVERMLCSSMRARVHNNSFKNTTTVKTTNNNNNNNDNSAKKSTVVLKISKKADINSEPVKVKKNIMIRHLTTIKGPGEFLYHLRYKGRKENKLALRNLRSLLYRCITPDHFNYALKGVKYYQWKGSDFNEEICATFIDLSIRAKKSHEVAALLVQSGHRMGAWMNKTSLKNILEALNAIEDDNNVELMVRIITTCVSKGLSFIVTTEALELIFMKIIKLNATDQYDQLVSLIEKNQSAFSPSAAAAVNLHELKAKYPKTAVVVAGST